MNTNITSKLPSKAGLEPLVPQPSLEDFKLERPPVFPQINELINGEVKPPQGLPTSGPTPTDLAPVEEDSLTLHRGVGHLHLVNDSSTIDHDTAESVVPGGNIDRSSDAEEVAAITRDQIRWDPRVAVMAQANTSPAEVLAVLK